MFAALWWAGQRESQNTIIISLLLQPHYLLGDLLPSCYLLSVSYKQSQKKITEVANGTKVTIRTLVSKEGTEEEIHRLNFCGPVLPTCFQYPAHSCKSKSSPALLGIHKTKNRHKIHSTGSSLFPAAKGWQGNRTKPRYTQPERYLNQTAATENSCRGTVRGSSAGGCGWW